MLPGATTQSTNSISAESFSRDFAADVRALYEIGESLGQGQFSVAYDAFAERIHRTVQKELLGRGEAEPGDHDAISEFIARLKADDLYLATACDTGDEQAWQSFSDRYRKIIERTAAQFCNSQSEAEDLSSGLLSDLFLPGESEETKTRLGRYSGMGSLQGWLKVMVHNRAIDRYRRTSTTTSIDDEEGSKDWEQATSVNEDPTETLLEDKYAQIARRALMAALDSLETKERLLLVYYYRDGLTLKEIGRMPSFNVHEATVSRWLEKIHKMVRKEFEQGLIRVEKLKALEIKECCAIAMKRGLLEIEQYLEKTG